MEAHWEIGFQTMIAGIEFDSDKLGTDEVTFAVRHFTMGRC